MVFKHKKVESVQQMQKEYLQLYKSTEMSYHCFSVL